MPNIFADAGNDDEIPWSHATDVILLHIFQYLPFRDLVSSSAVRFIFAIIL